jgi:hypothetical protein
MSDRQPLLADVKKQSSDNATAKKGQPLVNKNATNGPIKESPVGLLQLVSVLHMRAPVLTFQKSSFVMPIGLIISRYSSACVLL